MQRIVTKVINMMRQTLSHCGQANSGYMENQVDISIQPVNTTSSLVSRVQMISVFSRDIAIAANVTKATISPKGIEVENPHASLCGFI